MGNSKLKEYIEKIGDSMPGGFFVYRADEREEMIYVNDVTFDMFGCENLDEFKELTGYTFHGLVYPEDLDAIQNSIKVQVGHNEKKLDYVEYRIRRKDGEIRWIDDYGRLVDTKEYGLVYYVLIRDITELKKQAQAKLDIERSLENEIRVNDIRRDFLYNVSKDIRKPMDDVDEFVEKALQNMGNREVLKDCLEKIASSNRQMISVAENLLDMNLLDSGKIKIEETSSDIRELVSDSMGVFYTAAMEKRIEMKERFSVHKPSVFIDEMNFKKILYNILSNAVKFTGENGTITVYIRNGKVSESGYARYEIEVADTGIGMTEEYLGRLYDVFSKESDDDNASGVGIGLSVTKKLIDAMGGTISVKSKKGEGTTFLIGIPLKLADEETASTKGREKKRSARAVAKSRLLLAEGTELNRVIAHDILTTAGYEVDVVSDGSDAVKAVEKNPENYYSLILLDVHTPVMNGNEAARRIRGLDRSDTATVPIIALSKNARADEKRESIESGMNAHIAKPFDMTNLIDTINIYINRF